MRDICNNPAVSSRPYLRGSFLAPDMHRRCIAIFVSVVQCSRLTVGGGLQSGGWEARQATKVIAQPWQSGCFTVQASPFSCERWFYSQQSSHKKPDISRSWPVVFPSYSSVLNPTLLCS